jgi:predicted DNA-binding ribbon-helix-helix protein
MEHDAVVTTLVSAELKKRTDNSGTFSDSLRLTCIDFLKAMQEFSKTFDRQQ